MNVDRRSVLTALPVLLAPVPLYRLAARSPEQALPGFYGEIERRTFRWFWRNANRKNGLVPDRWPTPSFSSIASIGFALPAYAVGVERGWCSRDEARDLTLVTLEHLWTGPQGPSAAGISGHKGFFYHFLDMESGTRFRNTELSSVDTAILMMGVLFAGAYFNRTNASERQIRKLAAALYERVDWNFMRSDGRAAISMGWHPGEGLIEKNWIGFNEGMLVNILALGSPTHPAPANLWTAWTSRYGEFWQGEGPWRRLAFAPLFGHQYSQIFIDFRGIRDAPMLAAGFDYFENSRRETYANRAYCIANPMGWRGYTDTVWGLTACDGPGDFQLPFKGNTRQFFGYAARGPVGEPDGRDDGTLAPTAALASLPFAPKIVVPAAEALLRQPGLFDDYGFKDSFNPSFTYASLPVRTGKVDSRTGWVATDHLGIDQGPILLQAANFRDEFIWRHTRRVPALMRGLKRAGFRGGWVG